MNKMVNKFIVITVFCSVIFSCSSPVHENEKLSDLGSSVEQKVENVKTENSNNHPLTTSIIQDLIQHLPDHGYLDEDKLFMTDKYYNALVEAWKVPSDGLGAIGSDEWLQYFLTGDGGASDLLVRIDGVSQDGDAAKVRFSTDELFEDRDFRIRFVDVLPSSAGLRKHQMELEYSSSKNRWVISNLDNTLAELEEYPVKMREYFASDEWMQDVKNAIDESSPESIEYIQESVRAVNEYLNQ